MVKGRKVRISRTGLIVVVHTISLGHGSHGIDTEPRTRISSTFVIQQPVDSTHLDGRLLHCIHRHTSTMSRKARLGANIFSHFYLPT
ncbi:hypothetical protein M0804_002406 [Polistes exclamans]|nr:hypothetical protein M0804_002406 [Polistes exclamans]